MNLNRNTFRVLLVVEFFVALISMGLLFSDMGAIIYLIASVVFAIVLTPFFLRLKKATDEEQKKKIRRNIALVLLIPTAIAAVVVLLVIVVLFIALC